MFLMLNYLWFSLFFINFVTDITDTRTKQQLSKWQSKN